MPEIAPSILKLGHVDSVIGKNSIGSAKAFLLCCWICRCSKFHPPCQESTTLLVPNMFSSLGFMEMMLDEKDSDVALEV